MPPCTFNLGPLFPGTMLVVFIRSKVVPKPRSVQKTWKKDLICFHPKSYPVCLLYSSYLVITLTDLFYALYKL